MANETIRQQTGWFKGMDGKWRYEIADNTMKADTTGAYSRNPDIRRRNELTRMAYFDMNATKEQLQELQILEKNLKGVSSAPKYLDEVVSHPALFEAYPELRDVKVVISDDLGGATEAAYAPGFNEIVIKRNTILEKDKLKKNLIHEIQHAIQKIEGYAQGTNLEAANDALRRKTADLEAEKWRLRRAENELMAQVDAKYLKMYEEGTIPESEIDEMAEKEYAELERNLREGEHGKAVRENSEAIEQLSKTTGYDYYQNTAGEIEARDAARRRNMDTEARRLAAPDLRENVVFAENTGMWSAEYDSEVASIKEQIENSKGILNSMDVVDSVEVPKNLNGKGIAKKWAINILKSTGYAVDRKDFGEIFFNEKDIDRGMRYADTNAEKAAFAALPKVLKRGIEIGDHSNHKNRKKETITIAAPVEMNGKRGNMAVVVNKKGNHYYAHRIVLPDGSNFTFSDNKKAELRELSRGVTVSGSLAKTTRSAAMGTSGMSDKPHGLFIANNGEEVKTLPSPGSEDSQKSYGLKLEDLVQQLASPGTDQSIDADSEYMRAVKSGDMETAQRLVNEAAEQNGYTEDSGYQGTSAFNGSAPSDEGYYSSKEEKLRAWENGDYEGSASLEDFRDGIDINNLEYIAFDNRSYRSADEMRKEAILNIRETLNSGAKEITMYRSVPAGIAENSFRNGDWITPSREYAIENARVHGDYPGWENGYRIIEQKVPTSAVWWDGNDIAEWGYDDGKDSGYKNTTNNRKLLDPVTYDDEGNVIPLSERFNEEKSDIRYAYGRGFNDLAAAARPLAAPGITQTGTETSQTDNLPTKAREYLNRQENVLLRNVADVLGASKYADRRYMKDVVRQISEEYLKTGRISEESVGRLFDEAYDQARVIDEEWMKQNKSLADYLQRVTLKVNDSLLSNFADSNIWKKEAKKFVNMDANGSDVDAVYLELNEMYPEMFSADIINEADQLERIVDVAKDLKRTERTLDGYYGVDSDYYREAQYRDFEAAVYDAAAELNNVRRYADERAAKENKKQFTDEQILEAYDKLHGLRKAAEKAVNRNLLTEKDNHVVDRLLRGEITMEEAEGMKDINIRGVKKVYEAKANYEEAARVVKEAKKQRKVELKEKAAGLLEDADSWKDKRAGILYMRETAERNIRDIVKNKAEADAIIENYFTPVHAAEAESTRYKNKHRETIKNLNLSRKIEEGNKVSESYAVQLVGEAEANIATLEDNRYAKKRDGKTAAEWRAAISEFWEENPNLDKAKIENAIEVFREEYNGMIEDVNKVLVRNGYEPIPYRRGYFPHFEIGQTEGLFAQVKNLLGIDNEVTALPTEINGVTGMFKPGKPWFGSALERMGIQTDYDAVMGFDKYVQGISDVIHQTDNIQNLRALASEARYRTSDEGIRERINAINENDNLTEEQKQDQIAELYDKGKFTLSNFVVWLDEYTNLLANKKSKLDRGIESMFGRDAYNVLKGFEGRIAANMVSFNPGSWLTNFVPLTQAWTTVSTKDMLAGMWDTLKGYNRSDGFVDRSDYLTARFGSENLIKSWDKDPNVKGIKAAGRKYDQFIDWASGGMDVVDNFTSEAIVRARYYQNQRHGMSDAASMEEANAFAAGLQAARTKGSMPTIFESRNPIVKLFTQFQLEVNNEFSWLFKDVRPELKKDGLAKLAAGMFKFLIGSYIYNEVYEYFVGRRCALDPIGIVNDTVGNATGYQIPNLIELASGTGSFETQKQGTYGTVSELATNVAEELPFVGGLLGGGRLPISSAIPDVAKLAQAATDEDWDAKKRIDTAKKELVKPIAYLAAPGGGSQIKKVAEGHTAVRKGGSYSVDKDGNDILQYPVFTDSSADKAKAMIKTTLFGKSSLKEAREWVDSGFKSENAKNTQFYKDLREDGMTDREAYDYMKEFTGIKKTDEESANAQKRDFVKKSSVSGEAKADTYRMFASDKKKELMDSLSGEDEGKVTSVLVDMESYEKKTDQQKILMDSRLSGAGKLKAYTTLLASDNEKELIQKLSGEKEDAVITFLTKWNDASDAYDKASAIKNSRLSAEGKKAAYLSKYSSEKEEEFIKNAGAKAVDALVELRMAENAQGDKKKAQYAAILDSGLNENQKIQLFMIKFGGDGERDKINAVRETGLSFTDYLNFKYYLSNVTKDENMTKKEKVEEKIRSFGLNAAQSNALWTMAGYTGTLKSGALSMAAPKLDTKLKAPELKVKKLAAP